MRSLEGVKTGIALDFWASLFRTSPPACSSRSAGIRQISRITKGCGSTVYLTPVSYPMNTHDADGIRNLVDDAIVANANPPVILRSRKLPTSGEQLWTPTVLCIFDGCLGFLERCFRSGGLCDLHLKALSQRRGYFFKSGELYVCGVVFYPRNCRFFGF